MLPKSATADNDDGILDGEAENVGDFLAQRFDIITVIKKGEEFEIDHIEDAFYAPCR